MFEILDFFILKAVNNYSKLAAWKNDILLNFVGTNNLDGNT